MPQSRISHTLVFNGAWVVALFTWTILVKLKIVIEYDQEIPKLITVDERSTTITKHQEDKLSKAISSLLPIKMIANLE